MELEDLALGANSIKVIPIAINLAIITDSKRRPWNLVRFQDLLFCYHNIAKEDLGTS